MAQLQFKGKSFVQNYHMLVKYRQLLPQKDKSLTKEVSLKDNLILHGDNLAALKALMPQYAGKVKCIYIDPPYNTGNEGWAYNDNVTSPMMQEWLGKAVDRDDLTRHDKWLCMMTPRLKLLKELLRNDGVIFVSIDDNEVHHLISLMDEIFGEENFRNVIIVRRGAKNVQAQFENMDRLNFGAEYVICFTRSSDYRFNSLQIEFDETRQGGWNNHWRGTDRPSMRYELFGVTPKTGQWRWGRERSLEAVQNYKNLLKEVGRTDKTITQEEIDSWYLAKTEQGEEEIAMLRLSDTGKPEHYIPPSDGKYASSLWADLKPNGSPQLKSIFGKKVFENPKSVDLLKRLIEFAGVRPGDIVLDSFAGSGTTAHAVLALNKEDGGNRRFILVECEDYADKITAERVRRVIKGVPGTKDETLRKGMGGSFSYFDLGEPIDVERLLTGKGGLPSYADLARYLFYTATGEEFDEKALDPSKNFIGESKTHAIHLFYEPNLEKLKNLALTLNDARRLKAPKDKRLMVFAPTKYLDQEYLDQYRIDFVQLPYEIYKAFG